MKEDTLGAVCPLSHDTTPTSLIVSILGEIYPTLGLCGGAPCQSSNISIQGSNSAPSLCSDGAVLFGPLYAGGAFRVVLSHNIDASQKFVFWQLNTSHSDTLGWPLFLAPVIVVAVASIMIHSFQTTDSTDSTISVSIHPSLSLSLVLVFAAH